MSSTSMLQKEIDAISEKISKLLDLVETGGVNVQTAAKRLQDYEARKNSLEQELSQIVDEPAYTLEMFQEYLIAVKKQLKEGDFCNLPLACIEKIILRPNETEVILSFNRVHNNGVGEAILTYKHIFNP